MSETPPRIRTILIRDDKQKVKDLMDVVKIARAQGQIIFRTHQHVRVLQVLGPFKDGAYVAEVENPNCSKGLDVSLRRKKMKNE